MDTFMDRLAQKFTAQEMIKANAAAEAEELNRLREQVQEYTECLDRMQQICAEMERTSAAAKGRVDEARLDTNGLREQLMEIWKNVQDMQAMQQNSAGGQDDSSQRVIAEQLEGMRSAQDAQFENIKGIQADQIEDIKGMQAQQLESIKSMQDVQVEAIKSSMEDQLDSIRSMVKAQVSGIKNVQDGQLDSLRSALDVQNNTLAAKLGEMQTNLETQLNGSNDFIHKECVKVYRNVQAVVGEENNKQSDNLEYLIKPMTGKMKSLFSISVTALVFSLIGVILQVLNLLHIF